MNYLAQVQKGIDYIEANLDFDITLPDVANAAGLSQWHFQRIFKALSNETLKTYIRSRRLSNAFNKLLTTDQRILDIAITAGFESQESFTRAFKKAFDMTPNKARKIGSKNLFLDKIEINTEYLTHINQNISQTPEIYTQEAMILIGMKTLFYNTDSHKNNMAEKLPALWDVFIPRMDDIKNRVPHTAYGVIKQTPEKTDLLEYYAVCEVSTAKHIQSVPQDMVVIEVPRCRYARFTHKGDAGKVDNTVNFIYSNWLLQSNERHNYGPDLEYYGNEYIPDSEQSIMYYSMPLEN